MVSLEVLERKLGFHVGGSSEALNGQVPSLYKQGYKTFQVFFNPPSSLSLVDGVDVISKVKTLPSDINWVVHGPYVVSLAKEINHFLWKKSLAHIVHSTKICQELGIKHYVTHIGSIDEGQSKMSGYRSIKTFCYKWLERTYDTDVVLCLENDPGSKNGNRIGSMKVLYNIIKEIDDPRIRMAFDFEHAYANGFDLNKTNVVEWILDVTEVVHVNAIPHNVVRGKHLDRHSRTFIRESKEGPEQILNLIKLCLHRDKLMILERSEDEFLIGDFEYVARAIKIHK